MTGCVLSVTHRQMCSLYVSLLSRPHRMKMSKRRSVLKSHCFGKRDVDYFFVKCVSCVGRLTLTGHFVLIIIYNQPIMLQQLSTFRHLDMVKITC